MYDGDLIENPVVDFFNPDWWHARGLTQGSFNGRSKVHIVYHEPQSWVLRRYHRGGLAAKVSGSAYMWSGLASTRPWREWHLLAALRQRGLPVPQPVAAHARRDLWCYGGHLLSVLIEGAQPLDQLLADAAVEHGDWQRIGAMLRRFREAGVHHPDLNVRNILIDADRKVHLLDFDKGHLGADDTQFRKDLQRFRRSLDKFDARQAKSHISTQDWHTLLSACG